MVVLYLSNNIYLFAEGNTVSKTTKILSVWKKTVFFKIRHGYHLTMTSELFQRKENFYSHDKRNLHSLLSEANERREHINVLNMKKTYIFCKLMWIEETFFKCWQHCKPRGCRNTIKSILFNFIVGTWHLIVMPTFLKCNLKIFRSEWEYFKKIHW